MPQIKDYYKKHGKIPHNLTVGFSYLMALYSSVEKAENGYVVELKSGNVTVLSTISNGLPSYTIASILLTCAPSSILLSFSRSALVNPGTFLTALSIKLEITLIDNKCVFLLYVVILSIS